jgi:hypothetical protein
LLLWDVIVVPRIDEDELTNERRYSNWTNNQDLHQGIQRHIGKQSERHSSHKAHENVQGCERYQNCAQQREGKLSKLAPQPNAINWKYEGQSDQKPNDVEDHQRFDQAKIGR